MKQFFSTKRGRALLGVVTALSVTAVALAYFTSSTQSGSGQATAGSSGATIAASVTSAPTGLLPGGSAENVGIKLQNNSTSQQASFSSVTLAVTDVLDSDGNSVQSTCAKSNFTATGSSSGARLTVNDNAAGGTDEASRTGTVKMNETGVNQDGCKNVRVELTATPVAGEATS